MATDALYIDGPVVSLNVLLGAAGAGGFAFGWVRLRVADTRGNRDAAGADDLGEHARGSTPDVDPTGPSFDAAPDL